jgi:hypothetical protein
LLAKGDVSELSVEEESAGVENGEKRLEKKRVGPKLTGQTLLTHRRPGLSLFIYFLVL